MNEERNDAGTVQQELLGLARGLDKATNDMMEAVEEFEGRADEDGIWRLGVQLRYDSAVTVAEGLVMDSWPEAKRPPAQDRLHRLAELYVEGDDPELYTDFHRLKSRIAALQKVMSARKTSISARQSVLSAERSMGR